MPTKIEGPENISATFSIFHDGEIVNYHYDNDSLLIEVEIRYLAERIKSGFRKFMIRLIGVENIRFYTWPNDPKSEPQVLSDTSTIFRPELEILKGNITKGQIQVVCNQPSTDLDYCGGELILSAASVEVIDESGKSYSLEELVVLCNGYWDEWADKNKVLDAIKDHTRQPCPLPLRTR